LLAEPVGPILLIFFHNSITALAAISFPPEPKPKIGRPLSGTAISSISAQFTARSRGEKGGDFHSASILVIHAFRGIIDSN
jgi:hypothetical protein